MILPIISIILSLAIVLIQVKIIVDHRKHLRDHQYLHEKVKELLSLAPWEEPR